MVYQANGPYAPLVNPLSCSVFYITVYIYSDYCKTILFFKEGKGWVGLQLINNIDTIK
jgi:hypothetical protein